MGNLDSAREKVIHTIQKFYLLYLFKYGADKLPKHTEQISDQIIFELIKDIFLGNLCDNVSSLTNHTNNKDDNKNLDSLLMTETDYDKSDFVRRNFRLMQYSKYYRDDLNNWFENQLDNSIPKYDGIKSESRHYSCYRISDYDFSMIQAMGNVKLLKQIVSKKINAVKSYSNASLDDDYSNYRKYFAYIHDNKLKDDYTYILYSILLYTTELKYHIEAVYRLASRLSQYNNSRSKNKFPDDFILKTLIFNTTLYNNAKERPFIKENSLIISKINIINELTPKNLDKSIREYYKELMFSFFIKQTVLKDDDIMLLIKSATNKEIRLFIEKYYDIWSILNEEITWGKKKEKYIRDIYDMLLKDIQPPIIK